MSSGSNAAPDNEVETVEDNSDIKLHDDVDDVDVVVEAPPPPRPLPVGELTDSLRKMLMLSAGGSNILRHEILFREHVVSDDGRALSIHLSNAFMRLCVYRMAQYYGMYASKVASRGWYNGPEYGAESLFIKPTTIYLIRSSKVLPQKSLADWSAELHHRSAGNVRGQMIVKRDKQYTITQDIVLPLGDQGVTLLNQHSLPPDVLSLIFSDMSLFQLSRCFRVCKAWAAIGRNSSTLWRLLVISSYGLTNKVSRKKGAAYWRDAMKASLPPITFDRCLEKHGEGAETYLWGHSHNVQVPKEAVQVKYI